MKRLIISLIKKSGFFTLLIKLTSLFFGEEHLSKLSVDEALRCMNEFSPDPKTSSYRTPRNIEKIKWDLDIIVPCYNAEKTVRKCVDSCLEQKSNYSFRVIAIDDGSTDSTPSILDKYKVFPNVLVVHQENKGHSGARNAGLDLICSKYVMFVDSDDFIASDAIEKLMSVAINKDAALVEGGYATTDESGKIIRSIPSTSGQVNPVKAGVLKGEPWAKVIKSSILQNAQFPERYLYEDTVDRMIIYDIIAQSNQTAYCIPDCVYYYYAGNPVNISHTSVRKPKCLDTFYITVSMFKDRAKFGLMMNQDFYEYILRQICINYNRTRFMPIKIQEAIFIATRDFFIDNFQHYRTETKKLRYLEKALLDNNFKLYKVAARYTLI